MAAASTLQTDTINNSAGTGGPDFPNGASGLFLPSDAITNLGISVTKINNAMTIAIKQKDGATDPSTGTGTVTVGITDNFTSGKYNQKSITTPLSLTVASGATLGTTNNASTALYVYLIDVPSNGVEVASGVELAVSCRLFREDALLTTQALSGSSNSFVAAYSTTARSNLKFRLIGKITNQETTAGTWNSSVNQIQLAPLSLFKPPTYQTFTSGSGTYLLPAGCTAIRILMAGGGGGGAGSGTADGTAATGGNVSTFASLTANGGGAGTRGNSGSGTGGAGGSYTISGAIGYGVTGNYGGQYSGAQNTAGTFEMVGGKGGGHPLFGGSPGPSTYNSAGQNGNAAGSGGSGGGGNNVTNSAPGSGGGSGSFINAVIENANLVQTFSYSVAGSVSGGGAGASGLAGGNGSGGKIVVEETYG